MEDQRQENLDILLILRKIKKVLLDFLASVGKVISFSIRNIIPISIFIAVAVTISLSISLFLRPYYTAFITVSHIRLNNDYCSEMIYNLNTFIDGEENSELANELGISINSARQVKNIRYRMQNESLNKRYNDSTLVLLPFKIQASVYDKAVFDTLQTAIIKYMESNPLAMKLKKLDKDAFDRTEIKLIKEIEEIDSLKQIVNRSIIPRGTGKGIILGEPIDPISIYRRAMELFDRKIELNKKQESLDTFELIVGFNKGAKRDGPSNFTFILIGLISGYTFGLFWTLRARRPSEKQV